MKIGARAHDFGKHTPEVLFGLIKEKGLEAVHFAPYKAVELEGDFLEEKNIGRIGQALKASGMELTVLGCYVEPGSLDETVFEKGLTQFKNYLRVAKKLGAVCVGTETTNCTDENREAQYAKVLHFVKEAVKVAEEEDAIVAIEPVVRHTINTPEMLKRLIDDVNSPYLKVIFDPVNLLWEHNADSQEAIWDSAIALFGDKVITLHLKDGVYQDNHYTPMDWGKGIARLEKVAQWAKGEKQDITLLREEIKPEQAQHDIAAIKELFY